MSAAQKPICCAVIHSVYRRYRCSNKAKVERDGKHYCGTHDPVAVAAKRAAKTTQLKAEWLERNQRYAREAKEKALRDHKVDCFDDLLNALQNLIKQYHKVHGTGDMEMQSAIDYANRISDKATGTKPRTAAMTTEIAHAKATALPALPIHQRCLLHLTMCHRQESWKAACTGFAYF